MKSSWTDQILMTLDKTVRWTGIAERIRAEALYEGDHPRPRPLRWMPLFVIACSVAPFIVSLVRPSVLEISLGVVVAGLLPLIQRLGPLGNPSVDDDEREADLRKNSWLFCFGALAVLNCLGQPVLAVTAQLRNWPIGHTAIVVGTALMLNICLFGNLPTLYASWSLRHLPAE
jgi:hypothetical protein